MTVRELTGQLLAFGRRQPLSAEARRYRPARRRTSPICCGERSARTIELRTVDHRRGSNHALVDASQLQNALLNLALNARDADAAWRPADGRDLAHARDRPRRGGDAADMRTGRLCPRSASPIPAIGMSAGGAAPRLRAILHHEGRRLRHRARAQHGLWLRHAVGRPDPPLKRARPGHDGAHPPAVGQPEGGGRCEAGTASPLFRRPCRAAARRSLVVEDEPRVRRGPARRRGAFRADLG